MVRFPDRSWQFFRNRRSHFVDWRKTAGRRQKFTSIPTLIDASHAIAHNKVMLIDSKIVITGSFNFTKAAEERNLENLLIICSKELADRYVDNWWAHLRHSVSFRRQLDLK
jgi:phosphatidylserine/phosphatidylglycerophosphate/cardiolipin synthase-like enzyme